MTTSRRECPECGKEASVRKDGSLWRHWNERAAETCQQRYTSESAHVCQLQWADDDHGHSGMACAVCGAEEPTSTKGPWFGAQYAGRCDTCGGRFDEGDMIRGIGENVYECEAWCGQDDSVPAALAPATATAQPDAFEDPTPVVVTPEFNVSGQPKARYEWRGKTNLGYLVKIPSAGDFRRYKNGNPRGLTRVTTFNKAATDSKGLNDWGKRNVLMGASLRPDLVLKAHGLTHENDRQALDGLVSELETAAGAKVSADIGTALHELTEQLDAGVITLAQVPAAYRPNLEQYVDVLKVYGFEPVPGLIERTTMVEDFGGVVGTFDRILYHRPSGQYVIADVKTGKTLKYGMDEIECQEAIYARGFNANGVYDWNTDTWHAPGSQGGTARVSEDLGLIIHMPVQGPDAGTVTLVKADLQRGWSHAQMCHDVRTAHANKPKPEVWTLTTLIARTGRDWVTEFAGASSKQELANLYAEAYGTVSEAVLGGLVEIGRYRLDQLSR